MTLAPVLDAALPIRLHAAAALAALALGAVQLALRKGSQRHRVLGWVWVVLMALVAASSFFVHTICMVGGFSVIHLLSILSLVGLPIAVAHARSHRIRAHARGMKLLYLGGLVLAGLFTLLPGRIMHDVVFGTALAQGACLP
jgi:uncharacterized membrane protein